MKNVGSALSPRSVWLRIEAILMWCTACGAAAPPAVPSMEVLRPLIVTQPVAHDTDDPAIWVNPEDPEKSLVIGTDKDSDGALYAFDLGGKIVHREGGLKRPNNVDVAYGMRLQGGSVDIAVTTEREMQRLRVFSLPDFRPLDQGDLVVFDGDVSRAPMGIALYRRPRDGALYAIVGGKSGPSEGYLAQYRLEDDGSGHVRMTLARYFGRYSGVKEIEAIAVDAELGYVYYADETVGVRKYLADPDAPNANKEVALFGTTGFAGDQEGISIYHLTDSTGYILVSDQQANQFRVFPREGNAGKPHEHPLLVTVAVAANESDGSEVTSMALSARFPGGLFVAMSNDRTFHFYSWQQFAGKTLRAASLRPGLPFQ